MGCSAREVAPVLTGPMLTEAEIRDAQTKVTQKRAAIHDIQVLVRVRLSAGEDRSSFRYAVVYRRPSALRIEVFPLNGFYTVSLLGVLENSLVSLLPAEQQAYTGKPSRDVFSKVLGLPLTVEEIAGLLLAEPLHVEGTFNGVVEGERRRYLSADSKTYFETETGSDDIRLIKLFDNDKKIIAEATYQDYRNVGDVILPHQISLVLAETGITAELRIQKIDANKNPSDSLFVVAIPEGFAVSEVD